MSNKFASKDLTVGQLNAIVKKLGGYEGALRFLRGELTVAEPERAWRGKDGFITFTLTSDGTTGSGWITRLESKGFRVSDYAQQLLTSPDFAPTTDVTYEVTVLKGMLWHDSERITENIHIEAKRRGLAKPNPEIACLIRERFSDRDIEDMGFWWIVTMHELIGKPGDFPELLRAGHVDGGRWLFADRGRHFAGWCRECGFVFVAAQVSP